MGGVWFLGMRPVATPWRVYEGGSQNLTLAATAERLS